MGWLFNRKPKEPVVRSAYLESETPLVSYWSYFLDKKSAEQAAARL